MQFIVLIFLQPVLFHVVFMSSLSGVVRAVMVFAHGFLSTQKWELAAWSCLGPACLPVDQFPVSLAPWCLA